MRVMLLEARSRLTKTKKPGQVIFLIIIIILILIMVTIENTCNKWKLLRTVPPPPPHHSIPINHHQHSLHNDHD